MYNYFMLIGNIEKIETLRNGVKVKLKVKADFKFQDNSEHYDYPVVYVKRFEGDMELYETPNVKVALKGKIEAINNTPMILHCTKVIAMFPNGENKEYIIL